MQKIFSLLALYAFALALTGRAAAATDPLASLAPGHPRLFASAAQFARLPLQTDPVSLRLRELIRREAERALQAAPREYAGQVQNMSNARGVQGDILVLAMAYRLSGERRYAERAREHLMQLTTLRDWGLGHFLDVGETALAAGIGYDWLYDVLSDAERDAITTAIAERALLPSLAVPEGGDSWVNGNFNWNPVCHGGLLAAALAIGDRQPALARRVIERALRNLPIAGAAYSPDGATPEGPSYWSYGTTFYVLAIEALRGALGDSHGLEQVPGMLSTADFRLQLVAPSGQDFNYSDYHPQPENEPVMLWFARETGRAELAGPELAALDAMHAGRSTLGRSRLTPFELLWWHPPAAAKSAEPAESATPPLQWSAGGHMPIGLMRSAYGDPLATYVAIKGGTPDYSHGHMDSGSFILEAQGVRWALDLGTESYDRMRQAKLHLWDYTQDSDRWSTFRAGPDGHNILRMNGARQRVAGHGGIARLPSQGGAMGFRADLSSLYADAATRVVRTVRLLPDRSVEIGDAWRAAAAPLVVSFQWLTHARVTVARRRITLAQDGKRLFIDIAERDAVLRVDDVSAPPGVQNSPNPGLSRIVITRRTGARRAGTLSLKVKAAP